MKRNIMIIGAGGVAHVAAHKCAQFAEQFGDINIASRSLHKCHKIVDSIVAKHGDALKAKLHVYPVDAMLTHEVVQLIKQTQSSIVINLGSTFVNLSVLKACIETGAAYIDTTVHEDPDRLNETPPWYENYEWKLRHACQENKITAILSSGFDPGVVNAYAALAQQELFDTIDSIDIMDVNAGQHGRYFATNFDPEINFRELTETVWSWQNNAWASHEMFQVKKSYNFPKVGNFDVYLTGHDEIHSLPAHLSVPNIRFWMGFSPHYINVLSVLRNLGLLSIAPIKTLDGDEIVPLRFIKSILPDPASLAMNYKGETCIGNLVVGEKNGIPKELFIYNIANHETSYQDIGSQAIAYTAGVPAAAAAILVANNTWDIHKMANIENLPPKPYLKMIAELGLETYIRDEKTLETEKFN